MNYEHSYNSVHKWLSYQFGKASRCERCDTKTSSKYEYAFKDASKELGILKTSISNNLKGLSKKAGGYIWTIA